MSRKVLVELSNWSLRFKECLETPDMLSSHNPTLRLLMQSEKHVSSLSKRLHKAVIKESSNPTENGKRRQPSGPVEALLAIGRLQ